MILVNCKASQKHSGELQGFPIASLAAPLDLVVASGFLTKSIRLYAIGRPARRGKPVYFLILLNS